MYSIEWSKVLPVSSRESGTSQTNPGEEHKETIQHRRPKTHPTVWALGFTSLLTDVSSEMVASILPAYLVLYLGMSPLAFGLVDGLYQGAAVLARVLAGVFADRWQRHKEIAAFGYSLSAASRLLILAAGSAWGAIAAVIALDRVGKGIRTAPRDALIAQSSRADELSTAFGVHRALDAMGAMLGPFAALVVLALLPGKFDVLFVASFGIALVGLAIIQLFVPAQHAYERHAGASAVSVKTACALLVEPRFRAQVLAGGILGLSTISDSFIFLVLQQRVDLPLSAFPLLYVGTSFATAVLAAPFGRFADRFGRTKVLLGGYVLLAFVYLMLLLPVPGVMPLVMAVLFFGAYYAATDGVLTAMAASVVPEEQAGSGLAMLATATNLARLCGSIIFGVLWSQFGIGPATISFLLALVISIASASRILRAPNQYADGSAPI